VRRLLWLAVGAAAVAGTVRVTRGAADRRVAAGVPGAPGAGGGLRTTVDRALAEFRAGTTEREAELRADLLAGADLPHARARVDAWKAERAARAAHDRGDAGGADHTGASGGTPDDERVAGPGGPAGPASPGSAPSPRPGSAAAARRRGSGAHRAEDPDDGDLGYSFY
jgi:hypothetical protein